MTKRRQRDIEYAEHGVIKAVTSLVFGFILSALINSIFPSTMGEGGKILAVFINALLTIAGIIQLEKAKYWGLSYSLGFFLGLIIIGQHLMEIWEWSLYFLIILLYIILKFVRKAGIPPRQTKRRRL